MDIRNSLDSLRSLLGTTPATTTVGGAKNGATQGTSALGADQATLSNAGSEVSLSAGTDGVRSVLCNRKRSLIRLGGIQEPGADLRKGRTAGDVGV